MSKKSCSAAGGGGSAAGGAVDTGTKVTGVTVATSLATTGSGASFSIVNPYYALAYVMKS